MEYLSFSIPDDKTFENIFVNIVSNNIVNPAPPNPSNSPLTLQFQLTSTSSLLAQRAGNTNQYLELNSKQMYMYDNHRAQLYGGNTQISTPFGTNSHLTNDRQRPQHNYLFIRGLFAITFYLFGFLLFSLFFCNYFQIYFVFILF